MDGIFDWDDNGRKLGIRANFNIRDTLKKVFKNQK